MQSELNSVIVTENHTDGVLTHKYIQHEFFSSTLVCGGATRLLVEQVVEDTRAISANTCEVYKWSRCIRLGDTLKDSDLLAQLPLQLVFELEETTFETRYLFRVEVLQIDELLEVGSRELSNIDYEADIQAAQNVLQRLFSGSTPTPSYDFRQAWTEFSALANHNLGSHIKYSRFMLINLLNC